MYPVSSYALTEAELPKKWVHSRTFPYLGTSYFLFRETMLGAILHVHWLVLAEK